MGIIPFYSGNTQNTHHFVVAELYSTDRIESKDTQDLRKFFIRRADRSVTPVDSPKNIFFLFLSSSTPYNSRNSPLREIVSEQPCAVADWFERLSPTDAAGISEFFREFRIDGHTDDSACE